MRINYYEFPDGTPHDVLARYGCEFIFDRGVEIVFHDGTHYVADEPITFTPNEYNEYGRDAFEKWGHLVIGVNRTIGGITVTSVKKLMREFGGIGWTDHCERDGGCFETTEITLSGNNSRFKYNHHL